MKREPSPTKSVLKVQRLDQGLVEGGGGGTGRNQAKNYGFYALLSIFFFFVSFLYSPVVVHFMIVLLFFQRMILSLGKKRENISPFRFMYSPKEKDDEAPNEEEGH